MIKVVFLRHGQSTWNLENRFTGWTDVDLSPKGIEEARRAGKLLKHDGYTFDCAFTSVLKRAIRTLWLVQEEMDCMWLPVHKDWRLNERHYGALQELPGVLGLRGSLGRQVDVGPAGEAVLQVPDALSVTQKNHLVHRLSLYKRHVACA